MARQVSWGTPARSQHYQKLRSIWSYLVGAILLGLLGFLFLMAFQVVGVRGPLSPGNVTSAHANYDTKCEACHAPRQGASNLRCQRCHDTGGGGRLTQGAHVFFGSADARKATSAEGLACARCHIEHRGSSARLSAVDEAQCLRCHGAWRVKAAGQNFRIASFAGHPEFKVLRENLQGNPRMLFSHKRHMKEMIKEGAAGEWDTCTRCHTPQGEARGRDLEPINYDLHCARCHAEDLAMDPVSAQDVKEDTGLREAVGAFNKSGDTIQRLGIRHRDDWILYNIRKLQWETYPQDYARDRAGLEAKISQLQRRIFQAEPLVGIASEGLQERAQALQEEVKRLEGRARSQAVGADPASGLSRISEAVAAASAAGDSDARSRLEELFRQAEELKKAGVPAASLPSEEFEARRRELLSVLDVLAAADPNRQRSVDDLRRRLLALSPGESGRENLERALRQRRDDLARIEDELRLRRSGVAQEVRTLPERLALQRELDATRQQLTKFYTFRGAPPAFSEADRKRKETALKAISGEGAGERCAKCHSIVHGSLAPVAPAKSVMVRAMFAHKKHLIAALPEAGMVQRVVNFVKGKKPTSAEENQRRFRCAYCHDGIQAAGDAPRKPSVPAVQSCRECHQSGASRQDCQLCHRYHPPGVLS